MDCFLVLVLVLLCLVFFSILVFIDTFLILLLAVLFAIIAFFFHSVDSIDHLVLLHHSLEMFEDHLSGQESTDEGLHFYDSLHRLLVDLDAVFIFIPIRVFLILLLLEVSLFFIFVDVVV